MLTIDQAKQYLKTQGIDNVPEYMLQAWLDEISRAEECLEANYRPSTILLIQSYLIALMAYGQGDKFISSQTAPSGASRSFRYQGFADRWKGLLGLLRGLDKHGCVTDLIPNDPTQTAHGGLWIAKGNCYARGR